MKNRKAFTLIELLVVIGIIALLAGILLPAVNHMRRVAQITGQKADFQTIATALNQYKADFGDYPRNANLPTWNTLPSSGATPAPVFYSLAAALLGPGPAVTETVGTNLEIGDGADGPGFRCQTSGAIPNASASPVTVGAGATTVTMPVDPQYTAQASAFASNFVSASATPASITFFPTSGDPYSETVGVLPTPSFNSASGKLALNFSATAAAHNGTCLITQPGGKVWGPYISADTFKVAFIPAKDANGNTVTDANGNAITALTGLGQPVLLDRWGQVIQYFPTYGPVGNRARDSVFAALNPGWTSNPPTAGPLYGFSQPMSIDSTIGQNAIWDSRDGAPFFSVSAASPSPAQWVDPVSGTTTAYCQQWMDVPAQNFYPELTVQWMLGVSQLAIPNPANGSGDVIAGSDKLSFSGPYILISAGPDGPNRANGGYCNMIDPSNSGNPLPSDKCQQAFINSGNIYNFDRQ